MRTRILTYLICKACTGINYLTSQHVENGRYNYTRFISVHKIKYAPEYQYDISYSLYISYCLKSIFPTIQIF